MLYARHVVADTQSFELAFLVEVIDPFQRDLVGSRAVRTMQVPQIKAAACYTNTMSNNPSGLQ